MSWVSPCVHVWSCTKNLSTRCSINHLWEFHQIYILGAVDDRYELIRFWGCRVKGHSHNETIYGQVSYLGGIFSPISRMHWHILVNLSLLFIIRSTWHFQGHGFKGQHYRQHFPKMHFLAEVNQMTVCCWTHVVKVIDDCYVFICFADEPKCLL